MKKRIGGKGMRVLGVVKEVLFFSFMGVVLSSLAAQAGNINPEHDSLQTQAGDCTYCHVSVNTGPTLPKQAACLNCHVRWNPATTSLEVVGLQQEFGMPPMEILMHEIFSNSGEEIKIYDLAVCFSCHADPAKATVISPYHGSKVNGVVWSDNLDDPNDDPYAMFYYHPGRNTFNAMSYVFNNRNGSFNHKLYSGYGGSNCAGQTAQDLGKSEDNLCVPVPQYRLQEGDTWEFPVPGYELRTTIPFDNFGADSTPTFIDVPFFAEIPPPTGADPCPDLDVDGWAVCDASCDSTGLSCGDVCPNDPDKSVDAGQCGCGNAETDTDADGVADCVDICIGDDASGDTDSDGTCDDLDICPNDPTDTCQTPPCPDVDADGLAVCDASCDETGLTCGDVCPDDPAKTTDAGQCGCGVADTDTDGDGTADCNDSCPADSGKTDPGTCGCGTADTDTDGDGTADCNDACPADPAKAADAGQCGCGVADTDSDGDGTADCNDACPADPAKAADAGQCGCGVADTDTDGDGTADCNDTCPNDPDNDIDGDSVCGDVDACPADPAKSADAGQCGCGVADTDTDGDGVADCNDICPNDPTDSCQNVVCGDLTAKGDCNLHPGICEWVGNPKNGSCQDVATPVDADGDGYTDDVDCNDSDTAINPGATDIPCDGIDQDCSGSDATDATCQAACADITDKGNCNNDPACSWSGSPNSGTCNDDSPPVDADGDGYTDDVDCNDSDPAINPGETDIPCDGIDQDCSGSDATDETCQVAVCSDYDNTDQATCVANGCRWNSRKQSCR
jgi:hypothetical protein